MRRSRRTVLVVAGCLALPGCVSCQRKPDGTTVVREGLDGWLQTFAPRTRETLVAVRAARDVPAPPLSPPSPPVPPAPPCHPTK